MPDPNTLAQAGTLWDWARLGATGLMFAIWWLTFRLTTKQQETALKSNKESVDKLVGQMVDAYKDSLKSRREQNEVLQQMIKDQQENEAHMIQVLTQIKEQLKQPVKCPLAEAEKFNRKDH